MDTNNPSEEIRERYSRKLRSAAEEGHVRHVQGLIRRGADINYVPPIIPGYVTVWPNDAPLHAAAAKGEQAVVEILIAAGANLNQRTVAEHSGRRTEDSAPVHIASGNGHEDIVKALLLAGADIDVEDATGDTALQIAARKGRTSALGVLLHAGAHVNRRSKSGMTALHDAVMAGHEEIVKMLVAAGGDPGIRNDRQETALEAAKDFLRSRGKVLTPSMMELLGERDV